MKKGFTLIELLAVIVILAIIALIATPIILNIINSSKESAILRSAELYKSAVEQALAAYQMKHPEEIINEENCTATSTTLQCEGMTESAKIEMSGEVPKEIYSIKFLKGSIKNIILEYANGKIITLNENNNLSIVSDDTLCILVEDVLPKGISVGDKYICNLGEEESTKRLTFYVLEDGDNTTLTKWNGTDVINEESNVGTAGSGEVALLMDRNITNETVAWITESDYLASGGTQENWDTENNLSKYGPITALNYLHNQTSSWTKLQTNQITLPTYKQLAFIGCKDNEEGSCPTWAHEYLYRTAHSISGVYGYWLSSALADYSTYAWIVYYSGGLDCNDVYYGGHFGVRPAITISKSQLG